MSTLFDKDIKYLKGVGAGRARLFSRLGISSVGALLRFYPFDYEDWSDLKKIDHAPHDEDCCIRARVVTPVSENRIRRNMVLYKFVIEDDTAAVSVTIFNSKYSAQQIECGSEYYFYGKIKPSLYGLEMLSPRFESCDSPVGIYPVYHQTKGLTNRAISNCVKSALSLLPNDIKDNIPEHIRKRYSLCSLNFAIRNIHFPENLLALQNARLRLIFEEFFLLQLGLIFSKKKRLVNSRFRVAEDCCEEFFSLLPFELTGAQKRVIAECTEDMRSASPMNRLVQGDVGSGKTAVGAALCYIAKRNKFQAAFMAPTELLAAQHYKSLGSMFSHDKDYCVELLTSSTKAKDKKRILSSLKGGDVDLVIGTHALISDNVEFKDLGLIITDEQHRFGVAQRTALFKKGDAPHLLVMSATPIPRTLALMVYGDLDISLLDEMPPGRREVETYWINSKKLSRAYGFVRREIDNGRQAYIVCPLVEEGELDLVSAENLAEALRHKEFRDYRVGLLHGKMKPKEKDETMMKFKSGEIDLLVSTTVVEVGVDIPNASVMLIMNAERFGLSQLHQLRGRVCRGKHQSFCIMVSDSTHPDTVARLSAMLKTSDGFAIADEDLKLRGPGDFFGSRQHGLPHLKIANLLLDTQDLKRAQSAAFEVLKDDPTLSKEENSTLKASVNLMFADTGNSLN